MERSNKEMKRYRRRPKESRAKREKEVERMWREGVNGDGRVMGMKEAKQRKEDGT